MKETLDIYIPSILLLAAILSIGAKVPIGHVCLWIIASVIFVMDGYYTSKRKNYSLDNERKVISMFYGYGVKRPKPPVC